MACPPPDNTAMGKLVGLWPPPQPRRGPAFLKKSEISHVIFRQVNTMCLPLGELPGIRYVHIRGGERHWW